MSRVFHGTSLTPLLALHNSSKECQRCALILEAVNKWGSIRGGYQHVHEPARYAFAIHMCNEETNPYLKEWGLNVFVSLKENWVEESERVWVFRGDEKDAVWFLLGTEHYAVSQEWDIPFLSAIPGQPTLHDYTIRAEKWLNQCLSHHRRACPPINQVLPTRIIDVGDHFHNPKIYESLPGEKGAYCALSYCWGLDQAFTTTSSTLEDRKVAFHLDHVPKTIRDAIYFTRSLRIKYLWVDSLCIVQDSTEDWEHEAARMCTVYSCAVITFAAVDSPGSNTGLFLDGKERMSLDLEWGGGGKVFARDPWHTEIDDHIILGKDGENETKCVNNVLFTRGWSLQEIALSSRVLWMKAREMHWTCVGYGACECSPELKNDRYGHGSSRGFQQTLNSINRYGQMRRSSLDWVALWYNLVDEYTTRQLTHITDCLPAISGLAAQFKTHIKVPYLYGLWQTEEFLEQLLWYCYMDPTSTIYDQLRQLKHTIQLDAAYAPSWSWVRCPGVIMLVENSAKLFCGSGKVAVNVRGRVWSLKSVSLEPLTSNPFGRGTGVLTIYSLLVPVTLHTRSSKKYGATATLVYAGSSSETDAPLPSSPLVLTGCCDTHENDFHVWKDGWTMYDRWYPDHRPHSLLFESVTESQQHELYILFAELGNRMFPGCPTAFEGLVIEKLPRIDGAESKSSYQRLGYAKGWLCKEEDRQWQSYSVDDGSKDNGKKCVRGTWELWKALGKWESIELV